MRALFYHRSPEWTGSARVFAAAARTLAARGHEVTYVCPPESAVEAQVSREGFDVAALDDRRGERGRLARVMRENLVEVTYVHTELEHWTAALAARRAGRGGIVRRNGAGGRLATGMRTRAAMRLAPTALLFTSPGELQGTPRLPRTVSAAVADVGVPAAAYDAVRPAPRASLGADPGTRLVVCATGAGQSRPHLATVLRTVGLLAPQHPELRLAIVGPGSDTEDLRMHAAALGITGVVAHLGERDDQLAVLAAADIGWVASGGDDAAYAALDFMALRVPVLAERDTIASRYVAHGITGELLPPEDPPATAAAVAQFIGRDELRVAMGNAAHARVLRDFGESAMAERFLEVGAATRDRARAGPR
jgi:glycosyltransferase involved in cell wall biosynthesis